MARVLIAWEFGAGLGHLTRLLPVATALGREGHRLVLALQDLGTARVGGIADRLAGTDFVLRQAPRWPIPRDPALSCVPTDSLADVLKLVGYHDTRLLSRIAESWRKIFEEVAPDLVIADFSPSLRMAIGLRVPLIVLGNGYTNSASRPRAAAYPALGKNPATGQRRSRSRGSSSGRSRDKGAAGTGCR